MDIDLHYIEEGHGNALILLHGNGEKGADFKAQIAYFSKNTALSHPIQGVTACRLEGMHHSRSGSLPSICTNL